MLRSTHVALAIAALLVLTFHATDASAGWVDGPTRFDAFYGFHGAPFAWSADPAGIGAVFPYYDYPFYGNYPVVTGCALERLPIKTIYGLGWRNVVVCAH